jgi:hypothetical protein
MTRRHLTRKLQGIGCEVIPIKPVGREMDFFAHPAAATRCRCRLESGSKSKIPNSEVFLNPRA